MTTVVLCGEKEDTAVRKVLMRALKAYGGVQFFDGGCLKSSGERKPAYLLYDSPQIPKTDGLDGILIFKNKFFLQQGKQHPVAFLPVLEAHNIAAAAALKGTGSIAVTCGTSPRDTFSMASLRDDSAVVSLQRDLRNLDSQIIEPHDITIRMKARAEVYPLLASCAVLLLSGIPSQNGFSF